MPETHGPRCTRRRSRNTRPSSSVMLPKLLGPKHTAHTAGSVAPETPSPFPKHTRPILQVFFAMLPKHTAHVVARDTACSPEPNGPYCRCSGVPSAVRATTPWLPETNGPYCRCSGALRVRLGNRADDAPKHAAHSCRCSGEWLIHEMIKTWPPETHGPYCRCSGAKFPLHRFQSGFTRNKRPILQVFRGLERCNPCNAMISRNKRPILQVFRINGLAEPDRERFPETNGPYTAGVPGQQNGNRLLAFHVPETNGPYCRCSGGGRNKSRISPASYPHSASASAGKRAER